ncbi:hypothetical protein BASA61_009764 [Batrachochytrium salamandrivorans]|nr:hypothetical protein BASA61_009764 [Batrachochytrium salamandrivorans]KAH6581311.1 hypothetical protein BASA60_002487 [Batrachochytrium salamandrivorans]
MNSSSSCYNGLFSIFALISILASVLQVTVVVATPISGMHSARRSATPSRIKIQHPVHPLATRTTTTTADGATLTTAGGIKSESPRLLSFEKAQPTHSGTSHNVNLRGSGAVLNSTVADSSSATESSSVSSTLVATIAPTTTNTNINEETTTATEAADSAAQPTPSTSQELHHLFNDTHTDALNTTGCLNNCSGVGQCLANGYCICPPKIHSWWNLHTLDCSDSSSPFGFAWPYFRYSWLGVYTLALLIVSYINYLTFEANSWRLGGVRHICLCLVHMANLTRFLFFAIDPYSISGIINPIASRILLSSFYLFFIMAYVIMALHWVDICRTALALAPSTTLRYAPIGAAALLIMYFSLEIIISVVQVKKQRSIELFMADTLGMAAIMGLMIPLYIYYGSMFVARLKAIKKDSKGRRDCMIKKIRVITYGPATAGLLSVAVIGVKLFVLRRNPFLFLIGESLTYTMESISVALFLYGIMISPPVGASSVFVRITTFGRSMHPSKILPRRNS